MKAKKLVLFISLVAIMVCMLALTASASTYISDDNIYVNDNSAHNVSFTYIMNNLMLDGEFVSTLEENVGLIYDVNNAMYGYVNIEWWREYFTQQNVVDSNSLLKALDNGIELGYWTLDFCLIVTLSDDTTSGFLNSYNSYINGLQSGDFQDGYDVGYDEGYDIGYDKGLNDYTATDKYKSAIQAQYNKGLEDGSKNDAKGSMDLMSILTLIATLCTICGFFVLLFKNSKRKALKK